MNKVKLLSPDVISKIAAGEVVDRPASVTKELVENSLDAGATSVEVNLKEAGKLLIQIKDNGHGIVHDDLENAFLRHATSKIKSADDLFDIHSLGFRGEALYSIAAVSDVILKSRTANDDSGSEIHLRGGEKLNLRPASFGGTGTEIEIKELFFNTPARKKFLKSNTAEIQQVLNIFIPYTLLYPQVRFRLTHQGKDLVDLSPTESFIGRIAAALNLDEKYLLRRTMDEGPASPAGGRTTSNYKIDLILGDINIKRTRRDLQFIFVNNRPVQNKNIAYHLNQICRLIMPEDFYPFFAVYITVPPDQVDVNIHPTKREIKIKDEQALCSTLRSICEELLMKSGQIKQVTTSQGHNVTGWKSPMYNPSSKTDVWESESKTPVEDYAFPRSGQQTQFEEQQFFIPKDSFLNQQDDNLQKKLQNAKFVGSFLNKFLLFESGSSLLFVDQHAAAERITFEQLIRQMEKGNLEVQNLLAPVLIKLTPQEFLSWEEVQEDLEKAGLSSTQFDSETIAIHTHPLLLKDTEKAVRYILSGETIDRSDFETIARRACRSSIMAGDKINQQQAEFQREQLLQCLDPFTCPHGRPTIIELKENFLDKQFLRC